MLTKVCFNMILNNTSAITNLPLLLNSESGDINQEMFNKLHMGFKNSYNRIIQCMASNLTSQTQNLVILIRIRYYV